MSEASKCYRGTPRSASCVCQRKQEPIDPPPALTAPSRRTRARFGRDGSRENRPSGPVQADSDVREGAGSSELLSRPAHAERCADAIKVVLMDALVAIGCADEQRVNLAVAGGRDHRHRSRRAGAGVDKGRRSTERSPGIGNGCHCRTIGDICTTGSRRQSGHRATNRPREQTRGVDRSIAWQRYGDEAHSLIAVGRAEYLDRFINGDAAGICADRLRYRGGRIPLPGGWDQQ
jgi:hypothetical protein